MHRSMTASLPSTGVEKRSMALGMRRGARMRCPNCGQGALYRKYLKVQACPACGNDNTVYPSDDAPPYFTILIVGHLVVAPLLVFPFIWQAPTALVLATVLPALLALTMLFLPVVKGAVVGAQWALQPRDVVEEA
jgi:uncharacterized protein (DUF983 family)